MKALQKIRHLADHTGVVNVGDLTDKAMLSLPMRLVEQMWDLPVIDSQGRALLETLIDCNTGRVVPVYV